MYIMTTLPALSHQMPSVLPHYTHHFVRRFLAYSWKAEGDSWPTSFTFTPLATTASGVLFRTMPTAATAAVS